MSRKRDIHYIKPENYKILNANGAWGGVTPRGDYLIHFYYEYVNPPEVETLEISTEGVRRISRTPETPNNRRDLIVGISLPLDHAEGIANWILNNVKQFREAMKKGKTKPQQQMYT